MSSDEARRKLAAIYQLTLLMLPVLGVLILGWSAFDMVFIYLTESAIFSFFGIKKQNKIGKHTGKRTTSSPAWVFILFGFFYLFIRLMGSFVHAFDYSKDVFDFRDFPLFSLFLGFMLAPLIHNPELLVLIALCFFTELGKYVRFVKYREYERPAGAGHDKIFGTAILTLFITVFISFTVFWFATLIGKLLGIDVARFVNTVLAFVLLSIQNRRALWVLVPEIFSKKRSV